MKIIRETKNLRIIFRYKDDEEYNKIINNHLSGLKKTHDKYAGVASVHFQNLKDFNKAIKILEKI